MFVAVHQYLSETTVHGLVHFTGERRFYIKLLWLVAVLVSFSYCTLRVSDAYIKFVSKNVATTVQANQLEFEFPDVYICNENPISGSYSVTLNEQDSELLSRYRRMVNNTVFAMDIDDTEQDLDSYGIRLVNTLPFRFLSDKLGHRLSSILFFYLEGNTDWSGAILHHPFYINCFNLNLTNQDRVALQNPSNIVQVALFLDPQLLPPFDNSTEQDIRKYQSGTINLKPVDLDSNYGTDFTISNGFRVFLTPKGQHPSDFDTQVVVGPGQNHRVVIKMQDTVYSEADFSGNCERSSQATADFLDPYSGKMQTFKYSHAVCWYREVTRLSEERFNCSVWRMPIPWEYRSLPSCFNTSLFLSDFVMNTDSFGVKRADILNVGRRACERKIPCRSRAFTYEYSSSSWPSDWVWKQFLRSFVTRYSVMENADNSHIPGIKYLVYNSSFDHARQSLVQLSLSAAERLSSEVQLSLAYNFNSLIADVGGLLGLFLGMSLLSLLELLELLHGCILLVFERSRSSRRVKSHAKASRATAGSQGLDTADAQSDTGASETTVSPVL